MDNATAQTVVKEDCILLRALEQEGFSVTRAAWNNKDFNWSAARLAVFRST